MPKSRLGLVFSVSAALMLVLASGRTCQAAMAEYTIDSSQSSLTLSGSFTSGVSIDFEQQLPGSLVTNYSGTIVGDLSGGVLSFAGGSTILALGEPFNTYNPKTQKSGNYDNYGIALVPAINLAEAALRDLQMDFVAGSVQDNQVPDMTNGISLEYALFTYAVYSNPFGITPFSGEDELSEGGVDNTTSGKATLTNDGVTETLIIPIRRYSVLESDDGDVEIELVGQLYATRAVPEPSTFLLFGLAMLGFVGVAWRKSRR